MADRLEAVIEAPQLGELLLGNAARTHNRIAKSALRDVLLTHAQQRIPGHFTRPAHARYGYAMRSAQYRHYKQRRFHSSIDLVMTGRTKHAMGTQRQIQIGGTAAAGTLDGRLKLRFPFSLAAQAAHARRARGESKGAPLASRGRRDGRPRVTIEQMRREIAAFVPAELAQIQSQLRDRYVDLVNTTAGRRQRVKT